MPRSMIMAGDQWEVVADFDLSTAAHHPDEFHPLDMRRIENALTTLQQGPEVRLPPIVVLNGYIIDGKHRCMAYHIAGIRRVPAVVVRRGSSA